MRITGVLMLLISLAGQGLRGQSPSFTSYTNPVIPGDHPDATLTKIGNDFYTTGSSFNVTPVIYHSTDLVHWEAIAQPVTATWLSYGNAPGGGCWGGQIVYHEGKYWDYFSRANTMYYVKADQPRGPWSQPVKVNNPSSLPYGLGYDNSVFIDDDNKWYLVVKNGQPNNGIVELGDNGQPTGVVYNLSWLNPGPSYPYSWAEGPVMWKAFGYYYYSFARDLAGGQKVMRSQTLTAEQSSWEMLGDFFNQSDPLKSGSLFTEPNHSSAPVMLDDSTWWVIHPLYAKGQWKGQGRQGLLNQVHYNVSGKPIADYPVNKSFMAPALPSGGIPWMVPKSDTFSGTGLNPEWSFLGYTPSGTWSLTERPGWLRLSPNQGRINMIIKNDGEHGYSLITRLEFDATSAGEEAGLIIMRGDEKQYTKLCLSVNNANKKVVVFSFDKYRYETENPFGNIVWLKIERLNHTLTGFFSKDGSTWIKAGNSVEVSNMDSYSDFSSFTGTRQGIYVQNKQAWFDLYIYKDAYTQLTAESPANWSGTILTSGYLDQIHNNDWALYAGIEFGNGNYHHKADSVFFTASSISGGNIEVWLDSIDTGIQSGTCVITPTGSLSVFNIFKAPVTGITGSHDVYLRFKGETGTKLFALKSMQFKSEDDTVPQITRAISNLNGDTVELNFSQKMILPENIPFEFFRNEELAPIANISLSRDSLSMFLNIGSKFFFEDTIALTCKGSLIYSADSLPLPEFSELPVINQSAGYPPVLDRAITRRSMDQWNTIVLKFDKPLADPTGQQLFFNVIINDHQVGIESLSGNSDSILIALDVNISFGDTILISFNGGSITSIQHGLLANFNDYQVQNTVPLQTGFAGILLQKGVVLFPIPFKNNLTVKSVNNFSRIRIYHPSGKLLVEKEYSPPVISDFIHLPLPRGLYILEMINSSGILNFKVFSDHD